MRFKCWKAIAIRVGVGVRWTVCGRQLKRLAAGLIAIAVGANCIAAELPLFDVHLHYTWNQAEITTPADALAALDAQGIERAVVIGTPPQLALELYKLAPRRIVPIYGPYLLGGEKLAWQFRHALVDEARAGLETGVYRGIGELHLIAGQAMNWRRSKVFTSLLELAAEFDVPVLLHTEYSDPKPTLDICQTHPQTSLIIAHAGAVLPPRDAARILDACPKVMMDLAARDPWRYVNHPITDAEGRLLPDWEVLIVAHADRFMVGADTVWPVDSSITWDINDTGWQELGRFVGFHRRWLSFLSEPVAQKIRWDNAQRLFGPD